MLDRQSAVAAADTAAPAPQERHGGMVVISSAIGVRALCDEILSPSREVPVVGLTSRRGEPQPALAAAHVRAIVGDRVPIYFIPTGRPTIALKQCLPERLNAFGGAARIWWPGVSEASDPGKHPLIYDPDDIYGAQALRALARAIRRGSAVSRRSNGQRAAPESRARS